MKERCAQKDATEGYSEMIDGRILRDGASPALRRWHEPTVPIRRSAEPTEHHLGDEAMGQAAVAALGTTAY